MSTVASPSSVAAPTVPAVTEPAAEPSWRDSLAPELRDLPDVKDLPDVNAAVKRMVEARKMVGAEKIVIPGKDATPEEVNAYWTKLGRPESADKYEVPKENMPEGVTLDPALTKSAFEEMHRLGISKNQAAELVRWNVKMAAEQRDAQALVQKQAIETNLTALRKEFGKAFDEKDRHASNAIETYGGKEALALIKANPALATNPVFVKMMAAIGREIAEDPIRGGGHQQSFAKGPTEAQAEIGRKSADEGFMKALGNAMHPGHKVAQEEWTRLHQAAFPEPDKAAT